jgi:hypothetical protein
LAWAGKSYASGSPRAAETIFGWNRKSVAPIVEFIDQIYCKGVTLTKQAFARLNQVLHRGAGIDQWSVVIQPQPSNSPP